MMGIRCGLIAIVIIASGVVDAAEDQSLTLEFETQEALPNFAIEGAPAKIHTQGLFVTDRHFYVTGRLETTPRRALFLRFDRKNPAVVESVDITPAVADPDDGLHLDHPGGFDFDGRNFWIPVSASQPNSRTVVLRVPHQPDQPLSASQAETAFAWDDHIGAIAYDRAAQELCGANWDTKIIYRWRRDGTMVQKIPRDELVRGDKQWGLAVQDWKGFGARHIIASGIDKSSERNRAQPSALVAILDIPRRTLVAAVRLPTLAGAQHSATREGMAVYGEHLFFLPDDLGQNAQIYRYRWKAAAR